MIVWWWQSPRPRTIASISAIGQRAIFMTQTSNPTGGGPSVPLPESLASLNSQPQTPPPSLSTPLPKSLTISISGDAHSDTTSVSSSASQLSPSNNCLQSVLTRYSDTQLRAYPFCLLGEFRIRGYFAPFQLGRPHDLQLPLLCLDSSFHPIPDHIYPLQLPQKKHQAACLNACSSPPRISPPR